MAPAGEYEKAKEEKERATDTVTFNFTKRRGIVGEIKIRRLRLIGLRCFVKNG